MSNKPDAKYIKTFSANFEILCISLLIDAYKLAIIENEYSQDWNEDDFTNYLVSLILKNPRTESEKLFVKKQSEPDNENLPHKDTKDDPAKQPVIDIWLANWKEHKNEYYIEAKNLANENWQKSYGAKVKASDLKRRYINSGMYNFLTGRYPKGCLAGYVIKSKADECTKGINKLLKKYGRAGEILKKRKFIKGFDNSYISSHPSNERVKSLKHVFLEFD